MRSTRTSATSTSSGCASEKLVPSAIWRVTDAVTRQIAEGTSFSLAHPLEVEVAEVLVDLIPCAEMVRFGKNGSDATSGAVRLARAYTECDVIACCGYHGWQD